MFIDKDPQIRRGWFSNVAYFYVSGIGTGETRDTGKIQKTPVVWYAVRPLVVCEVSLPLQETIHGHGANPRLGAAVLSGSINIRRAFVDSGVLGVCPELRL